MIPPKENAAFVACMENLLDLYHRPYDPKRPLLAMDEHPVQLIGETRIPVPEKPGHPRRYDYEYERNGTAANFLFLEPLTGRRKVHVRERRTAVDWAYEIQELLEVDYPDAEVVVLVCDNLSTHTIASLYKAFPPEKARSLAKRLELHYTPKHGSWLNVAEIELSVLARQCLDSRIPDLQTLTNQVEAWKCDRNEKHRTVDRQFRTTDARIKLKKLYPKF